MYMYFRFFRLRGLLLLIIDYLALLRALLSVLFSRVSVCASESTHQRTNAMAGDSVLRNISLEHLRRGHAPTGGEEIVLDKRTRTVSRTSHLFFPADVLRTQSLARPLLLLSSRTLLDGHFSSSLLFFFYRQLLQQLGLWNTRRRLSLHYVLAIFSCLITSIFRTANPADLCHFFHPPTPPYATNVVIPVRLLADEQNQQPTTSWSSFSRKRKRKKS